MVEFLAPFVVGFLAAITVMVICARDPLTVWQNDRALEWLIERQWFSDMISAEITAEINREVVQTIQNAMVVRDPKES
jgi:hypothetical protein